ncbi:MAG: type IV secretory system conjugative DNA transfer family protein [Bacillota bacterium]
MFLGLLAGLSMAAARLSTLLEHPAIFSQFFTLSGFSIYAPWSYILWRIRYINQLPNAFHNADFFVIYGFLVGVAAAVFGRFYLDKRYHSTTHGSASWATNEDIEKTGLMSKTGVILGMDSKGKKFLRHDGPEHIMMFAPTRSGKGVGVIIPTLLTWPHSVMITDIKGENWSITSGYRQKKLNNTVLRFEPTSEIGSARFNPLEEIRLRTKSEVRDVQNIVEMLVNPNGTGLDGPDAHWKNSAGVLLTGVILHLLYIKEKVSLNDVAGFISNPDSPLITAKDSTGMEVIGDLNKMLEYQHETPENGVVYDKKTKKLSEIYENLTEGIKTHPIVAQAAREMIGKADNERSGVVSTAVTLLGLYRDPIVANNTGTSDFRISDLMNLEKPVSLYLVVPPSDISRTRPLIRLILNLVICRLTETMNFKDGKAVVSYKHRLLLLMDEFPALGQMDTFEKALAYIAGYGMKALLIIQDLAQLNKVYKENNSIMGNCHIRIAYAPNDIKVMEYLSKLLGTRTEVIEQKSYNNGHFFMKESTSLQEVKRELLTPGEIAQLPPDAAIINVAGHKPIWTRKIKYYSEPVFTKRVINSPPQSDIIKKTKTNKPETTNTTSLETTNEKPIISEQTTAGYSEDAM